MRRGAPPWTRERSGERPDGGCRSRACDLPEPETPVTQVKAPSGNATSMSCRLLRARAHDLERLPVARAPARRARDRARGRERYCPVERIGVRPRPRPAALRPPPRPHGARAPGPRSIRWSAASHRLLVVLDDEHRVARGRGGRRACRGGARCRADGARSTARRARRARRASSRAELGGEPDPLRLAAGERGRRAVEREVVEPDVDEEREARSSSFRMVARQSPSPARERQLGEEVGGLAHREMRELADRHAPPLAPRGSRGRSRWPPQLAHGCRRHEAVDPLADAIRSGLPVAALEMRDHALERAADARPTVRFDFQLNSSSCLPEP